MNLAQYTNILTFLERTVKPTDPQTAFNLAREFSVLYVKLHYDAETAKNRMPIVKRLASLVTYVDNTLPAHAEILGELIIDSIETIKNPA